MNNLRLLSILTLIILALSSRFLPHPPNFTALNAVALFSAYTLGNLRLSSGIVFTIMAISDYIIGFHSTIVPVYLSFGLIIGFSHFARQYKQKISKPSLIFISSLIFFVVTNWGVWLMDSLYPKTVEGLALCYIAALPFFSYQLLGDLTYGLVLFGSFSVVKYLIPSIRAS